ncbi:MAG: glycosyltransferase family 2 protein [Calothrix sp. C42_A2020_038]|nr:glycosyltransferase family 2 protein [Calothrix sp. C42_A2020_038]
MSQDFQLKTPVVFIIFKRPHTTEKVFEAIRQAKPPKLFVIADGPRSNRSDEPEKCKATRAIIERVDWDCEVIKNYSETNLACGRRVVSGLDWVFAQVEEAIILEDDVVPHPTFFRLCEELLERYRHDKRVFSISAQNVQLGHQRTEYSYYFSRYWHSWGWATWRRAWQYYDFEMKQWEEAKENNLLQYILMDMQAVTYWTELFQSTYDKQIDTWDYQWTFTCWLQNALSIIPNVNMISHIGFDTDATHNFKKDNKTVDMPIEAIEFPLKHPPFVIRNAKADNFTQRVAFEGGFFKQLKSNVKKLVKLI